MKQDYYLSTGTARKRENQLSIALFEAFLAPSDIASNKYIVLLTCI